MSMFGKYTIRFVKRKSLLQARLPVSITNSFQYAGSKINADGIGDMPEKPKKPLTPYFRFMADMRPELKKDHPDSKVTDIVKMVAEKWEKTPFEDRQKYMEEYKKDLITYSSARIKYEEQLTEEQKHLMKRAKDEIEMAKENRKLKKKMIELGKPKRPASAFLMFFNTKLHSRGDTPFKDWVKNLAKEWSDLPPELKASYHKEYSAAMENHRRQIQEWEERMIRMGHIDVVRSEALIEPKTVSRKLLRTRHIGKNKQ